MGSSDVIELLLLHKADVDTRGSENWTPLHWSSREGGVHTVWALLEHGADVNAFSETDGTPLHLALQDGFLDVGRCCLDMERTCIFDVEMIIQPHSGWPHRKDMAKSHKCLLGHGAEED
jgi:ankyrin repeat protein